MEHRLGERRPAEQMVRVVVGGKIAGLTKCQNISPGGISILNPDIGLKKRQIVTLDFIKPGFPEQIHCGFRTMVIHIEPEVVGLMFEDEFAGCELIAQADHVKWPG